MGIEDFGAPPDPILPAEPEQEIKTEEPKQEGSEIIESIELTLEEKYRIVGKKNSILDMRGVHFSIGYMDILIENGVKIINRDDLEAIADALLAKHIELKKIEDAENDLPETTEEATSENEMGPVVDLVQELTDANIRALAENPDYKKEKDSGKMSVWRHLSDDAKTMWNYQVWNPALLTSPDGLQGFMDREPHRKIDRIPNTKKKIKIVKPKGFL